MRNKKGVWYFSLALAAVSTVCTGRSAFAADPEMTIKNIKPNAVEEQDRLVDQVAITAQRESIRRLERLLTRYKNTSHEPTLLAKLAELLQQEGALKFRVAHGKANRAAAAIDLSEYKKTMNSSVGVLDRLISRYKDYEELDLALYMRAKAYQEVGDKVKARSDFNRLVKNYPNAPEATSAYMSLAEYAVEDNQHELALQLLSNVEKKPEHGQYPFALYKMGWSHYNLNHIPQALSYLERHVAYYKMKHDGEEAQLAISSDQAIRENSLMDIAMFYFEGIEKKFSEYSVKDALPYFKKQDPGPLLGRMTVRFAKHLRAAGLQDPLNQWKEELIQNEVSRPETIEVAMIVFEDQINKRKVQLLGTTARDFVRIYRASPKVRSYEAYIRAQKLILDTAEKLQALAVKNKDSDEVKTITTTLSALYSAFIDTVNSKDERVPKVHYNLAETLFEIQDYSGATEHYRWVVENWNNQKTFDLKVASIKAIASRYEVLRAAGIVPKELKVKTMVADAAVTADPRVEEWIQWIDRHASKYPANDESFENFQFEANRTLYAQGLIQKSAQRFLEFSEKHPQSKFAIPASSVVMDTYLAGTDWEKTHSMTQRLLKVSGWKGTEFSGRLTTLAADSFYKIAETLDQSGDYKATLDKAEDCIDRYKASQRYVDCLLLAGKSAMKLSKEEDAEGYFDQLAKAKPDSQPAAVALLELAQIKEKNFQFAPAAQYFRSYLDTDIGKKLSEDRITALWERTLQLLWLSGQGHELVQVTKALPQCRSSLLETCTRYAAFGSLSTQSEESYKEALVRVMHGKKEQKAVWALAALRQMQKASYKDRLFLIKSVADHWERLDAISKFALLSEVNSTLVKAIEYSRKQMPSQSNLKPTPKSIKRRVEFIQELEGVATAVMKMPWARVRAEVLNEVAEIYSDFAASMRTLGAPQDLAEDEKSVYEEMIQKIVFPFEEKGSDLRRKAFEVASAFAVETESFDAISAAFFKENPSQSKDFEMPTDFRTPFVWDTDFMNRISRQGFWKKVRSVKVDQVRTTVENRSRALQANWIQSLEKGNWAAAAFFLGEVQNKSDKVPLPESVIVSMKAYTLAMAGSRAEALALLHDERKIFEKDERGAIGGALVAAHLYSLSREKVKSTIKELESESDQGILIPLIANRMDAWTVAYGAEWSQTELSEQNRIDLFEEATRVSGKYRAKWASGKLDALRLERRLASVEGGEKVQKGQGK